MKKNESKNATGEDTYVGALRAPRAGSPDCVFAFVFVSNYVQFAFQGKNLRRRMRAEFLVKICAAVCWPKYFSKIKNKNKTKLKKI